MAKANIMVVEDANIVSMDIQRRLKSLGYEIPATAVSGEEAIEKAGKAQPDLVLMDICLKGKMDGVQAADQIRKRFNIPIVYLTAMSDDETVRRAALTEPFGYLLKPFDERDLRTTIEIALYKHQMEAKMKGESEQRAALLEVARILAQPWSFQEKCKSVLQALVRIAQADLATLRLPDADGQVMHLAAWSGPSNWKRPETVPGNKSLAGKAYRTKEPVVANDYPTHASAESSAVTQGIKSAVALPIKAGNQMLGVVSVASKEPAHFTPWSVRVLAAIADGLGGL
ncbi:MAG TPA: response regulator [Dehalococcoidia bacterium]|nr:response regulator [Dehalococcoidia bacterium]